jgi:hypothetical protein
MGSNEEIFPPSRPIVPAFFFLGDFNLGSTHRAEPNLYRAPSFASKGLPGLTDGFFVSRDAVQFTGDAEECVTGGSRVKNLAEKIEALKKKHGEYAAHLSALEKSGEARFPSPTPTARAMAAYTKVGVGYNAQIAVSRAGGDEQCSGYGLAATDR